MSDLRKAAEMALKALEGLSQDADEDCGEPRCGDCKPLRPARAAITALRAALDAQEPTRKAATEDTTHTCHPECDRSECVAVREAVKAERERICAIIREQRQLLIEVRDAWRRMDPAWCALHGVEQLDDESFDEILGRIEDVVEIHEQEKNDEQA